MEVIIILHLTFPNGYAIIYSSCKLTVNNNTDCLAFELIIEKNPSPA